MGIIQSCRMLVQACLQDLRFRRIKARRVVAQQLVEVAVAVAVVVLEVGCPALSDSSCWSSWRSGEGRSLPCSMALYVTDILCHSRSARNACDRIRLR